MGGGSAQVVGVKALGPNLGFLMARYLADGTPDPTFGTNGVSTVDIGALCRGARHELLPDGTTRQYGSLGGGNGIVVARDADGAVIGGFGTDGAAVIATGLSGQSCMNGLTMASGRIIGYGSFGVQLSAVRITTDPERPSSVMMIG